MQQIQLFINNQTVDLSTDEPISLTFQINNLAEVKNQQGNTSNQFKLPLTQNNRRVLGFPDDIRFTTDLPYTQYKAKVVQNGIEVVPAGIAELDNCDESYAYMTVLSGNVDFFDLIDAKIYDCGDSTTDIGKKQLFAPFNSAWNIQNVISSQKNTEGLIWPIIDYGSVTKENPQRVDIRQQRPGFFLKTAIDLFIKATGYRAAGSLLQNPLYPKLIVQFANDDFEHGTDYVNNFIGADVEAISTQNRDIKRGDALNFFYFNNVVKNGAGSFVQNFKYECKSNIELDISIEYDLFYRSVRNTGNVSIVIRMFDPGTNQYVDLASNVHISDEYVQQGPVRIYQQTYAKQKISYNDTFAIGQFIQISYEVSDDGTGASFLAGAKFTVKEKKDKVLLGQTVQCERIFPDISQKELLKDTLQRFGIICQTDNANRVVTFASFKDIVKNVPIARNWSSKCVNQGKNVSYALGNYAQVNNLKYKQDDAVQNGYADDTIKVNNKTLAANLDLFESQFAPSLNSPFVLGSIAQIKKIEDSAESLDFTVSTSPRILIDQKISLLGTDKVVHFQDGITTIEVNDTISVPYFHKQDGDFTLCWCDKDGLPGLRSIYYKELERILTNAKKVVRYFALSPIDIAELDLLIPVYLEQDNAYYYINKLDSWRKGVATKAELVKLGEI